MTPRPSKSTAAKARKPQGFAALSPARRREIAAQGGASHSLAHLRAIGAKGGKAGALTKKPRKESQ